MTEWQSSIQIIMSCVILKEKVKSLLQYVEQLFTHSRIDKKHCKDTIV